MDENRIRKASVELQQAAKELRQRGTRAERGLWSALRGRQLGFKVRRQHAVGRFILDFYIPDHRLAIEVDGDVHDFQRERDAERTAVLNQHHVRVLRFRNEEVLNDLPAVLARIRIVANPFDVEPPPLP
ncbi:MAG TPA: DUF559 domain-containing protein [Longimicrobium sp.]|nr:DUF559 domain-containing protein [Longimicrobium sp.]